MGDVEKVYLYIAKVETWNAMLIKIRHIADKSDKLLALRILIHSINHNN
jgi:hypothetical protein